ncbi:MAG: Leu/Phe/Val dehydrogenase [Chthoniobacterales bacterium]
MNLFTNTQFKNHEQVSFFHCEQTGLKAIIAIHNTNLGPALGGCRMWAYQNDDEALYDVLRLSQGMTYKAALAGLPLGGGKSVIIGDPKKEKTPAMMRAMGRAVESLGGRYIIAEDVGTCVEDMNEMSSICHYVTGALKNNEGSGDPSPVTAYGVFVGIKAAVKSRLQKENLQGLSVALQGLGNVGYHLAKLLHEEGVKLYVTDIDENKISKAVKELGAIAVPFHDIYDVEADIFAPCALGAIINDETIPRLKFPIIAGASNNQLAEPRHGDMLAERGILYAPDYAINTGGLISVYSDYALRNGIDFGREKVFSHTEKIGKTLEMIFAEAKSQGISTAVMADRLAERIFLK